MMNHLKRKLCSCRGASMILAMVFMLFCAFVGGSVLASATANGYRVAQLAEEQDFLLERSAALLLSDQLRLNEGEYLRLKVSDEDRSTQPVQITPAGVIKKVGDPTLSRVITFTLDTNITDLSYLQRTMVDSAVQRYLYANPPEPVVEGGNVIPVSWELVNFHANTTEAKTAYRAKFKDYSVDATLTPTTEIRGSIVAHTSVSGVNVEIPSYRVNYSCGSGLDIYSFFMEFGNESRMKLTNTAYSGISTLKNVVSTPTAEAGSTTVQITRNYTNTTISWADPFIEKGGVA